MNTTTSTSSERRPVGRIVWIALLVMLAVGLTLRVWNLGALGLVGDEGHQALAVEGILESGVPEVPSGNIYLRGAPLLYAQAAVAAIDGVSERALRLPAAIFGALTILPTFFLARRLFGLQVGLVSAALVTVSIWELELSRYARMYTLLQLQFVLAAYAFIRGYIDDKRPWRWLTLGFIMLAILTHRLGILTLVFFLIPAFLTDETVPHRLRGARRWALLIPAALCAGGWLAWYRLVSSLTVRAMTPAADGGGEAASGFLGLVEKTLRIPVMSMPLNLLTVDRPAVFWAAILALLFCLAILTSALRQPGRRLRALYCLTILGAAAMNLFSVALGLMIAALILFPGAGRQLARPPWVIALAGSAGFAIYWTVYLLGHPAALDPGWGEPWSISRAFFAFPPIRTRILEWFFEGWPRFSILVIAGLMVLVALFLSDRRRSHALMAAGFLVLPLVVVSFGKAPHNESRYHFHLYPFMVIVFAWVITHVVRAVISATDVLLALAGRTFRVRRLAEGLLVAVVALVCSRDLSPGELSLVIGRDYWTPKDPIRSTLNWPLYATFHQDHVGPSRFVREHLRPGDRVVPAGPTYWLSIYDYYIGRVDYAICNPSLRFTRDGHLVHHVTGVRCITGLEELEAVLEEEGDHRIWLIGDRELLSPEHHYFPPAMKARLKELFEPWDAIGRDNRTIVRCIAPRMRRDGNAPAEPATAGALH